MTSTDLSDMTVAELRAMAQTLNIPVQSKMRKSDLVDALSGATLNVYELFALLYQLGVSREEQNRIFLASICVSVAADQAAAAAKEAAAAAKQAEKTNR